MSRCILVFRRTRSGTTWIGRLFDSYSCDLSRHEADWLRPLGFIT
jgi:hypothetical protein